MHILLASSECAPFFKTGGLGDVVGTLPKHFVSLGHETTVVLPLHKEIADLTFVCCYTIYMACHPYYCGVFFKEVDGVRYYFIDNEDFFKRENLYGYDDDIQRFAYYDFAVLELISHLRLHVDVLHLHDWQSAMIGVLYKLRYCQYDFYKGMKVVLTIHNIAFQGKCDPMYVEKYFGLDLSLYDNGTLRHDGCFNLMKAGIVYSDEVTSVSPSYVEEMMTARFGEGLESVLLYKKDHVTGILNGIDLDVYKPSFTRICIEDKLLCKRELLGQCCLSLDVDKPLLCMVSRLTDQKGVDLVLAALPSLLQQSLQVIIVGSGDVYYENQLSDLARNYPNVYVYIGYDEMFARKVYEGSDIFMMPSLFEPCGLAQMIAMRYATVPVVRHVGGLKDSVQPYYAGVGTGFVFEHYDVQGFCYAMQLAIDLYYNKKEWRKVMNNCYDQMFDFCQSAKQYVEVFKK